MKMISLVALTYQAMTHQLLNGPAVMWRVEIPAESVQRLLNALMSHGVSLFQSRL